MVFVCPSAALRVWWWVFRISVSPARWEKTRSKFASTWQTDHFFNNFHEFSVRMRLEHSWNLFSQRFVVSFFWVLQHILREEANPCEFKPTWLIYVAMPTKIDTHGNIISNNPFKAKVIFGFRLLVLHAGIFSLHFLCKSEVPEFDPNRFGSVVSWESFCQSVHPSWV